MTTLYFREKSIVLIIHFMTLSFFGTFKIKKFQDEGLPLPSGTIRPAADQSHYVFQRKSVDKSSVNIWKKSAQQQLCAEAIRHSYTTRISCGIPLQMSKMTWELIYQTFNCTEVPQSTSKRYDFDSIRISHVNQFRVIFKGSSFSQLSVVMGYFKHIQL